MTAPSSPTRELSWLLDDLVARVASIRKALVLSGDGLATGASDGLTREDSEHLAAVASGFHSLAKGVGRHFDAGPGPADHRRAGRRLPVRHGRGRRQLPGRAQPTRTPTSARWRTRWPCWSSGWAPTWARAPRHDGGTALSG